MYKYEIKSLTFKNRTRITLGRINVLVGANNCGKTQVLKDISAIVSGENVNNVLIDELEEQIPNSFEEIANVYKLNIRNANGRENLIHLNPKLENAVTTISGANIKNAINNSIAEKRYFHSVIGPGIVTYLNTENRLILSKSRTTNDPLINGAQSLLDTLFLSGNNAINTVRKIVKKIFNKDIYLDYTGLGHLKIRFGDDFLNIPNNPIDALPELAKYQLLDNQGDGIRSIVGIISALVAVKRPMILIDEPEAFLHPPQAMQLGQHISQLVKDDQQIIIATHSADFLRGLLSSTRDAVIIHMDRSQKDDMHVNVLGSGTLNEIIYDPLLSSSRVLEGMFYKGVVITEADADSTFYQRAFQNVGAADEIHFVHAHNKQTIKKLLIPYEKLGIKHAAITDIDIIREEEDLKNLITIADANLKNIILQNRLKILEEVQKRSKFDILNNLLSKLEKVSKIPSFAEEESESILINIKRELKKICKESSEFYELKKIGYKALNGETLNAFNSLYKDCASIGLFIVKVGELESWLEDYDYPRLSDKSKWITGALEKIFDMTPDRNKELWKFIYELKDYLIN